MPALSINLLRQVPGVGASTIQNLLAAGYRSLDDLANVTPAQLKAVPGVGANTAQALVDFIANARRAADTVQTYRFDETRKNIPPAGLAAQGKVLKEAPKRYTYDPHLPPVLRFDSTGAPDRLPELLETAKTRPLTDAEARQLADALRQQQPWLEWTGKRETRSFAVDPVALHIHERLSTEAIVALTRRKPLQRSLFAEPELDFWEQVKFYQHEMDWTNRLILGDSLTVMTSLARREDLSGKVQMIYLDPPYGIQFGSNFQPFVGNREVKDREQDLTREPEQVKAYRDTWTLGIHSYLAYLRDRLIAARDLLTPEGSIFVQISDQNLHRMRLILDEVFGSENMISQILYRRGGFQTGKYIANTFDYILWYARSVEQVKINRIYIQADHNDWYSSSDKWIESPVGERVVFDGTNIPDGYELHSDRSCFSASGGEASSFTIELDGRNVGPPPGRGWSTNEDGALRLKLANRLMIKGQRPRFKPYYKDFPLRNLTNGWFDTVRGGFASNDVDNKVYVVQTSSKVIERCLLMTTDPADLVLDPTCGSGTTAYVAEQWGRRWITIDTSRVAIALARQRLLTAKFDYYQKEQPDQPLHPKRNKFLYESIRQVSLESIAQNQALDPVFARWESLLAARLAELNSALAQVTPALRAKLQAKLSAKEKVAGKRSITDAERRRWLLPKTNWQEWEVPFDANEEDWPQSLQAALNAYRMAWHQKMAEVYS